MINSSLVCIDKFIDEGLEAEFSEGFEFDKFEAPKSFSGISMSISKGGLPARCGSKKKARENLLRQNIIGKVKKVLKKIA